MKKESLIAAVLTLFLLACLNGVEGQYTTTQPGAVGQITPYQTTAVQPAQYMTLPSGYETTAPMTTATATTASQYAQYYTTGPAPNAHITAPQSFNIGANVPSTVYVGTQMQAMPYPQYYATYTRRQLTMDSGLDKLDSICFGSPGINSVFISVIANGRRRGSL